MGFFLILGQQNVLESNILTILNPQRYMLSPGDLTLGLITQYTAPENFHGRFIVAENEQSLYPC